jgi:hypothetical protein
MSVQASFCDRRGKPGALVFVFMAAQTRGPMFLATTGLVAAYKANVLALVAGALGRCCTIVLGPHGCGKLDTCLKVSKTALGRLAICIASLKDVH